MSSWASLDIKVARLPEHTPDALVGRPAPIDTLCSEYEFVPIETNTDAAAALQLAFGCMGLDIEDDGPGERLVRNVVDYLKR